MGQNEQSVVAHHHDHQTQGAAVRACDESEHGASKEQADSAEDNLPICRICHCSSEDLEPNSPTKKKRIYARNDHSKFDLNDPFFLITPCLCTGTLEFVHHMCLQQWIRCSCATACELCKYKYNLKKIQSKPIYKWESLSMTPSERRKLLFQLTFNFVSIVFVFWSIYVIAERATHELVGQLSWRFWLKMLIVTIGFICGILFIFFQLKLYISTIMRWKQYNQLIIIENVNSDQSMSMHSGDTISTAIDLTCCESK